MNATIFDFLDKWGDYDFRRLHIQPTDFLIFAILSYATFENTSYYKENKDKNKFFDIKNFYKEGFDNLNKTNLIPNGYVKFISRIHTSTILSGMLRENGNWLIWIRGWKRLTK